MNEISKYLPLNYLEAIKNISPVNEIRLKRGCRVNINSNEENILLDLVCNDNDFSDILDKLCSHSFHSHINTILNGYISLKNGYRIGVVGKAVIENGKIINIDDISSLNIRIPHLIRGVCLPLYEYIKKTDYKDSILIYSPPGGGKTTLLRDIAMRLSAPPNFKRVALIDSREELFVSEMSRYSLIDVYSGYPKAKGIEIAIRTMSPQIIICDEIGNTADSEAILEQQNAGIPIIASAHGDSVAELLERPGFHVLHKNAVFDCYMGISRIKGSNKFDFTITPREGIKAELLKL